MRPGFVDRRGMIGGRSPGMTNIKPSHMYVVCGRRQENRAGVIV
jgi:hypothetical protein